MPLFRKWRLRLIKKPFDHSIFLHSPCPPFSCPERGFPPLLRFERCLPAFFLRLTFPHAQDCPLATSQVPGMPSFFSTFPNVLTALCFFFLLCWSIPRRLPFSGRAKRTTFGPVATPLLRTAPAGTLFGFLDHNGIEFSFLFAVSFSFASKGRTTHSLPEAPSPLPDILLFFSCWMGRNHPPTRCFFSPPYFTFFFFWYPLFFFLFRRCCYLSGMGPCYSDKAIPHSQPPTYIGQEAYQRIDC